MHREGSAKMLWEEERQISAVKTRAEMAEFVYKSRILLVLNANVWMVFMEIGVNEVSFITFRIRYIW